MSKKYVVSYSVRFYWLIDAENRRSAIEEMEDRARFDRNKIPREWQGMDQSKIRTELQAEYDPLPETIE
jgi:hypothetical protein